MKKKTLSVINLVLLALILGFSIVMLRTADKKVKNDVPLYADESAAMEERIADAVSRMTLEEKVAVLHAQSKFSSAGVPSLGIPELWCTDGPHGIRPEVLWDEWEQAGWTNDSCTAFPALTCLAASWSEDMSALYGKSIGEEACYREKDVLLGPGVNIYRTPLNGRNFEYMGEDPYLASRMVVPYVQGVQSNGVAACVKHYALNNQEENRHTVNVIVDDRTLHEIYLPAFKAAVQDGGAWSIMSSYNLYKKQHVSHNQWLLNDVLKRDWHFDGAVISDWGGVHDTDEAITNGMDLEFGSWTDGLTMGKTNAYDNYYLADPYLERLRDGRASEEVLNEKVSRVLRLIFRTAMKSDKPCGSLNSDAHIAAAREIGAEGIVLLKNEGSVLPLGADVKKIAVIGENAVKMMTVGGGSSSLKVKHEVSPLEGLRAGVAEGVEVAYERGYVGDVTGNYNGVTTGQDLSDSRSEEQLIEDAVALAKTADAVIFIGGLNKSGHQDCEGHDRLSLGLPYAQDKVIEALAEANNRLIVALVSGNAVAMPWLDKVPAIVQAWFCGSQAGNSLADVLYGKVNPSGKLPFTFPAALTDNGAHALNAYDPGQNVDSEYKEGIYVGYRWAEKHDVKPLFAFGHGLSYTTFAYKDAKLGKSVLKVAQKDVADSETQAVEAKEGSLTVSVKITNTGDVAGKEVVQLYLGADKPSVDRAVKELKGFRKVALAPGETKTVTFEIVPSMLRYYNVGKGLWSLDAGDYTAYVAAASDDVKAELHFEVK